MWFLILAKVLIYSGCQISLSLTNITTVIASTNKLINNLRKVVTLISIFCWKSTLRFLTCKNQFNLQTCTKIFAMLVNLLLHLLEVFLKYLNLFLILCFEKTFIIFTAYHVIKIWFNNRVYHSKRVLILLENFFKILRIFVKTCPGIINPIHLVHQYFN